MANQKSYYELGKGTTTYHPFSVAKRSKVQFDITSIGKKHEKVGVYIEKNVNGTWKKVGYGTTVKPDKYDSALLYGLEAGKYRLALKTPKDQIINIEYTRDKSKKKAAYKKSKAINLNQILTVYILPQKKQRVGIRLLFHLPKKEKQLHCPKILWVEVLNSVFIKKENG